VLFSLTRGGSQNLWEIGVSSSSGKVNGSLERLTSGSGNEVDPACGTSGAVVFTRIESRQNIWSLPFNVANRTPESRPERIDNRPATEWQPSLSQNGRYLVFLSDRSGVGNVWIRELATGKESSIANSLSVQGFPLSNASGSRVAFSAYEKDKRVLYVSVPGGTPERLCEGCLRATDWSRDEKSLLVFGGDPYQINALDLASHQQRPLLKHAAYHLLYARYSPDNKWVSFTARVDASRGRIAIAPVDGPTPVPEDAWVTIAEAGADDYANWSPDGKTLYFTSGRDGYNCLWALHFDPTLRRPTDEPFAVQHLHGRLSFRHGGWSATAERAVLALAESSGNVWLMSQSASAPSAAAR
jgi:Tol biopolymer transport system component